MQYTGIRKRQKYPIQAKTSNDNVFQFSDSNNFCINTFWIGAITQALYKWSRCSRSSFEGSQTTHIQSPTYGANPKSVNTKVVAINKLKHIVIGGFCLNWIFWSSLDTCILHYGTQNGAMILRFWEYLRSFWRYHYKFFCKIFVFLCCICYQNISL